MARAASRCGEHRGLTAAVLADAAGITQPFLSQLETGKRAGTLETLQSVAAALGLSIQDLAKPPAYLQMKALLGERPKGMTVPELAAEFRYSQSHIRAFWGWLEAQRSWRTAGPVFYWCESRPAPP